MHRLNEYAAHWSSKGWQVSIKGNGGEILPLCLSSTEPENERPVEARVHSPAGSLRVRKLGAPPCFYGNKEPCLGKQLTILNIKNLRLQLGPGTKGLVCKVSSANS